MGNGRGLVISTLPVGDLCSLYAANRLGRGKRKPRDGVDARQPYEHRGSNVTDEACDRTTELITDATWGGGDRPLSCVVHPSGRHLATPYLV